MIKDQPMPTAPTRRMGRPTLDEAVTLQQRILDEAIQMLRTAGSGGFSIDQLADRVNITKRTIYRHYTNKTGLIIAVVDREVDLMFKELRTEDDPDKATGEGAIKALHDWVRHMFHHSRTLEMSAFFNYLCFESMSDPLIRDRLATVCNHIIDCASHRLAFAQSQNLIRPGEPRRFALLLLDLVSGLQVRSLLEVGTENLLGGEDPERYFDFRWLAFMSLVGNQPWNQFASLTE